MPHTLLGQGHSIAVPVTPNCLDGLAALTVAVLLALHVRSKHCMALDLISASQRSCTQHSLLAWLHGCFLLFLSVQEVMTAAEMLLHLQVFG